MRHLHFIFIALPVCILLDVSSFIADYLDDRRHQHNGWWNGENDGMERYRALHK